MFRRHVIIVLLTAATFVGAALLLPSLHQSAEPQKAVATSAPASSSVADSPAAAPAESLAPIPAVAPSVTHAAPRPAGAQVSAVSDIDPRKAFGSKNAPVVVEVFSDFQCPACKTLFLNVNPKLVSNYVETNKIYLIHRDFPLPMHAHSKVAARYARAAAHIGKGEAVEQALFQNQEKWEQSGDVDGTVAGVLTAADMTKVRGLVKSGTLDASIDKDTVLGQGYHVNQTPTTIIHAKGQTYPVVGVVTYEVLKSFLDQLLAQR